VFEMSRIFAQKQVINFPEKKVFQFPWISARSRIFSIAPRKFCHVSLAMSRDVLIWIPKFFSFLPIKWISSKAVYLMAASQNVRQSVCHETPIHQALFQVHLWIWNPCRPN
jgi:hypothetical protein